MSLGVITRDENQYEDSWRLRELNLILPSFPQFIYGLKIMAREIKECDITIMSCLELSGNVDTSVEAKKVNTLVEWFTIPTHRNKAAPAESSEES